MTWPAPSRADHDAFCLAEGWTIVRKADGKDVDHHVTYEKVLTDGRILRTRVSRPPNKTTYGAGIWGHILRDQLAVDAATFWACVQDGVKPDRGEPKPVGETVPADLIHLLKSRLKLSDAEIAELSRQDAIDRMTRFWQEGAGY